MAELDDMIARLRGLGATTREAVPEVADECKTVLAGNIAAQRGPDGEAWPKSKDGAPVLVNAAKELTAQAVNGAVLITLRGPEARHHLGIAKGRVQRRILPSKGIPAPMSEAIRRVLFRKLDAGVK